MTHAYLVDAVTVRLCEEMDKDIPKEQRMPVFLHEIAMDGYLWNNHAEHLGENGNWRLRHTDFDNAPDGREVHWSSAFAWYLRGLGEVYRSVTGDTLRNSIFRMSLWANPILLSLAILGFAPFAARRFGPLCGAVMAIGMVTVPTFYEGFQPAYPDHHGLIAFTIMGMLFGIAWAGAGWVQKEDGDDLVPPHSMRQAKIGMIISAVCGATGMWVSAISHVVVLAAIGLGAVMAALFFGRRLSRDGYVFNAGLWKLWAGVGAAGSSLFYLLEYFPNHLGMRMEVNHPLYSLAWLGGGWMIALIANWLCKLGTKDNIFPWQNLLVCAVGCAFVPLTVLMGGSQVYIPFDPFMSGLWKNIRELLTMAQVMKLAGVSWFAVMGWLPVLLLIALALLPFKKVQVGTKAVILFLIVPIVFITVLQMYQVRWGMLAGPIYIALAGVVFAQLWRLVPPVIWARVVAIVVLSLYGIQIVGSAFTNNIGASWTQFKTKEGLSITSGQAIALIHRQMARTILDSAEGKPVVLLSSPNSSAMLGAMGGFSTIGTLYWENVAGLKAAAEGLNTQTDEATLAFVKKHGITHVSLMTWENFVEPYFNILYPTPMNGVEPRKSFGIRALYFKQIPMWVRPLIYPANVLTKNMQQSVLMLKVVTDQNYDEARFHLARFVNQVELKPELAEKLYTGILESAPNSSLVRVELANLYLQLNRFDDAVGQVILALPDGNAETRDSIAGQFVTELSKANQWQAIATVMRALASFPDVRTSTLQNVAWILSTLPEIAARDPKFALTCLARLEKIPHDATTFTLTRSAALAATGDYKTAAELANSVATGDATVTDQIRQQAQQMRDAYTAEQPWGAAK